MYDIYIYIIYQCELYFSFVSELKHESLLQTISKFPVRRHSHYDYSKPQHWNLNAESGDD